MRERVFADPGAKRLLESILHPRIGAEAEAQAALARGDAVVFDVPLLVESGRWRQKVDRLARRLQRGDAGRPRRRPLRLDRGHRAPRRRAAGVAPGAARCRRRRAAQRRHRHRRPDRQGRRALEESGDPLASQPALILYEYPFNESIRTMLRLEHLFDRLGQLLSREAAIDHHHALATVFEIMDVGARADLKSDLLKDLERHRQQYASWRGNPGVDEAALAQAGERIDGAFQRLNALREKPAPHSRTTNG
jgi:hypothetical protein